MVISNRVSMPVGWISQESNLSLKLRLRLVVNASTVNMVTGCTSGTNLPSHLSNNVDTTRWLVTPPNLHSSLIHLSTTLTDHVSPTLPVKCVLLAMLFPRQLFTFLSNSGTAVTPVLPFL